METVFTSEFRAQITTKHCVLTVTGSSPAEVQKLITQALGGKTTFNAQQHPNTVLVYNDQHFKGEQPIGWIGEYQVPEQMGIEALTEQRLGVQRAA